MTHLICCPLDVLFNCSLARRNTFNASGTLRKNELRCLVDIFMSGWLYIKITNHSSTLSCLLDCINCGIDKSRITYYNNAVTSFTFLELHTQPSGDIHPQPGPDSQLSIPVRITQRSHRQKNSHLSCNHSTSTRIISKTMPTRCSSLMTINTTSSSKRIMESLCLVSRVPYTSKSSTEAHMANCRNPNSLITIQRLPLKASNARHMSMCLKFALCK